MSTYDVGRTQVVSNLETSVGSFLTQQILANLNSSQQTLDEGVTILSNFKPGDAVPPGTDIVIVQPGAGGGVTVPDGVSAVIFTGPTGVQVSLNLTGTTAVQLTGGSDVVTLSAPTGEIASVNAGAGNDVITGAQNAANAIVGGLGNDSMTGGSKNDAFGVGEGNDVVNGGGGFDQAFVKGSASDYDQKLNDDGSITLTNKKTGEVSKLTGVEFLTFEGGGVLLNVNSDSGIAAASLYEVVLGRAADAGGQNFFAQKSGPELVTAANQMLNSQEFTSKFGDVNKMTDQQFIDIMYKTAFDRGVDTTGLNYWLSKLAGGMSKGELALNFAYSAEAQSKFDATIVVNKKDPTLG